MDINRDKKARIEVNNERTHSRIRVQGRLRPLGLGPTLDGVIVYVGHLDATTPPP